MTEENQINKDQKNDDLEKIKIEIEGISNDEVINLIRNERKELEEIKKENQSLKYLAEIDPVTEQLNRRAFLKRVGLAKAHADRSGENLVAFIGDIDNFKAFNDRYGHYLGDGVLKLIGNALKVSIRNTDSIGRWSGDEWGGILIDSNLEGAKNVKDRFSNYIKENGEKELKDILNNMKLNLSKNINYKEITDMIKISFGFTSYIHGEEINVFFQRADRNAKLIKDIRKKVDI